jgi:ribose 5-phosphate isomerase B
VKPPGDCEVKIIIGSDHAGFALKEKMKSFLNDLGCIVTDVGTQTSEAVDYPDFGAKVAGQVSSGEYAKGLLVCGSGVGMAIVANRFPGVRAVVCLDSEMVRMSRLHNDTNLLVLAGRRTGIEKAADITRTWLETAFEGGRHLARLEKIKTIEKQICKLND